MLTRLRTVVANPLTDLVVGLLLLATSADEVWESLGSPMLEGGGLGAHHGVVILGLHAVMRSLPALTDGIRRVTEP